MPNSVYNICNKNINPIIKGFICAKLCLHDENFLFLFTIVANINKKLVGEITKKFSK